jgi:hypothetical protein
MTDLATSDALGSRGQETAGPTAAPERMGRDAARAPHAGLTGMRLLSIVVAALWAAIGVAVLIAYHPGGPFDLVVRAAIFCPLPAAVAAAVWPPSSSDWRVNAAIAWLGILSAMLLVPLLIGILETLIGTGRQALFPSAEVAYAAMLALGMTTLFAAIGVVGARGTPLSNPSGVLSRQAFMQALILTAAVLVLDSAVLGIPSLANELALRDRPLVVSRFGPTDTTLPIPRCDTAPAVAVAAELDSAGTALVDGEDVAHASLHGVRRGPDDEAWAATLTGRFDNATVSYRRSGPTAVLDDPRGSRPINPGSLTLPGGRGLTVDDPIAALVGVVGTGRVAEDRGIELIEEARSRHCHVVFDGSGALSASVVVRLLVGGTVDPVAGLKDWRGGLDWWVFADGQLGQAIITIGGYPGDAWPSGGLQGSVTARVTATNRSGGSLP